MKKDEDVFFKIEQLFAEVYETNADFFFIAVDVREGFLGVLCFYNENGSASEMDRQIIILHHLLEDVLTGAQLCVSDVGDEASRFPELYRQTQEMAKYTYFLPQVNLIYVADLMIREKAVSSLPKHMLDELLTLYAVKTIRNLF